MNPNPWRGFVIGVLCLVAAAAAIYFCMQGKVLWVLVPIPAGIGLIYHYMSLQPRFENRLQVVDRYREFAKAFAKQYRATFQISDDPAQTPSNAPVPQKLSSPFWAAVLLTAVLAIPAAVSGGNVDNAKLSKAMDGMVFAGLGVYALIVLRMIGRMNGGALHARFMITAALRATIAQVLGLFAGASQFFETLPGSPRIAYFLIGLFYPLFVEQLRDKAVEIFSRKKEITDPIDVKAIDGVDDDVAEILTELAVTDVQHVAVADPAVLTARSLYSFENVVDWINQAILIERFRDNVTKLRVYNIRGIGDWIPLMEPVVANSNGPERADADAALNAIATAVNEPVEVLRVFGRAIYRDYKANLLWQLTQRGIDEDAKMRGVFDTLEEIAFDDGRQFRSQHPAVQPNDDQLRQSYAAAEQLALQSARLSIRALGDGGRRVYETAFRRALDMT